MFYETLNALFPEFMKETLFRVFSFTTFRAICALAFALSFSLLLGPWFVRRLAALKAGQQVRQFKTTETQQFNIHQHKMGTPTMGGLLIIISTLVSVLLFCDLSNSYVWITIAVMLGSGALGFYDDYLKIAQKNHKGVSAKIKIVVQGIIGCALGAFLLFSRHHTAYGPLLIRSDEITNISRFAERLREAKTPLDKYLRSRISTGVCDKIDAYVAGQPDVKELQRVLAGELNEVLQGNVIYEEKRFVGVALTDDATERLKWRQSEHAVGTDTRLNRLLIESAYPQAIAKNNLMRGDAHLLVPIFKEFYPYLGLLFIPWVAIVIICMSNAVNLTDGLDGLAIGTVITVSLPYMLIAYLVSRYDFSSYLFVPHVPQAGQLAVFLSGLIGASMGFLWFNSHPAEVFMGDTGSLSLGATIGAIAILCKHELLLLLIAGIFVIEAVSVVMQVASYRLRGKRILLMSPLHNHFVKKGMDEAKIISRFLIVATLLAMAGLSLLKVR